MSWLPLLSSGDGWISDGSRQNVRTLRYVLAACAYSTNQGFPKGYPPNKAAKQTNTEQAPTRQLLCRQDTNADFDNPTTNMDIATTILNVTMRAVARQATIEELYLKDGGTAEGVEKIRSAFRDLQKSLQANAEADLAIKNSYYRGVPTKGLDIRRIDILALIGLYTQDQRYFMSFIHEIKQFLKGISNLNKYISLHETTYKPGSSRAWQLAWWKVMSLHLEDSNHLYI